jgi:hypothetical protein
MVSLESMYVNVLRLTHFLLPEYAKLVEKMKRRMEFYYGLEED